MGPLLRATTHRPPVHVHVKLRAGAAAGTVPVPPGAGVAALAPLAGRVEAMFAPLPPADDRARWLRVRADGPAAASRLALALAADPAIEQAFVEPAISLPSQGHSLAPPDEEAARSPRRRSSPTRATSARRRTASTRPPRGAGFRGAGVWFADIEGGWNAAHEDLPGDRITHVSGRPIRDPSWRAHGTAVLGEVVGRDNGKGVVGIAPDVERILTSSIGDQSVGRRDRRGGAPAAPGRRPAHRATGRRPARPLPPGRVLGRHLRRDPRRHRPRRRRDRGGRQRR